MCRHIGLTAFIFLSLECVAAVFDGTQVPVHKVGIKETINLSCVPQNMDYHAWYQVYQNVPGKRKFQKAIGNIPLLRGVKRTYFTLKSEMFDNNTEIYCVNYNRDNVENESLWKEFLNIVDTAIDMFNFSDDDNDTYKSIIHVTEDSLIENEAIPILKYNEAHKVSFSCSKIGKTEYVQLGIINTTSNIIETLQKKKLSQKFNKTHNGTILCCVSYVVYKTNEIRIYRYVEKKTLLIYDGSNNVDDNNVGMNNNGINNGGINRVGMNNDTVNNEGINNVANNNVQQDRLHGSEIISNSSTTSSTYSDHADAGNKTNTYITATASVGAVLIILLVLIIIWKKYSRNRKPASDAMVLYADLDILRQTEPRTSQRPRPGPVEESAYVQIIGEMRPQ